MTSYISYWTTGLTFTFKMNSLTTGPKSTHLAKISDKGGVSWYIRLNLVFTCSSCHHSRALETAHSTKHDLLLQSAKEHGWHDVLTSRMLAGYVTAWATLDAAVEAQISQGERPWQPVPHMFLLVTISQPQNLPVFFLYSTSNCTMTLRSSTAISEIMTTDGEQIIHLTTLHWTLISIYYLSYLTISNRLMWNILLSNKVIISLVNLMIIMASASSKS